MLGVILRLLGIRATTATREEAARDLVCPHCRPVRGGIEVQTPSGLVVVRLTPGTSSRGDA